MSDADFSRGLRALEAEPGALSGELAARLLGLLSSSLGGPWAVANRLLDGCDDAGRLVIALAAITGSAGGGWELRDEEELELDLEGPAFVDGASNDLVDRMDLFGVFRRPHVCDAADLKRKAARNMGMPPPVGGYTCDACDDAHARRRARRAGYAALSDHQGIRPGPFRSLMPAAGAGVYVDEAGGVTSGPDGTLVGYAVGGQGESDGVVRVRLAGLAGRGGYVDLARPTTTEEDSR